MVVEGKTKASPPPQWWWFENQNNKDTTPRRSPWLQSTLSELDEKTKAMLRIIEEDADSFAQRAEMYYKKRPELITMVEDFYRAHRSLAERHDQIKSDVGFRVTSPWALASPLSVKYQQVKSMMTCTEKSYDSYSETYDDPVESAESEVDDPEQEEERFDEEKEEDEEVSSEFVNDEVMKLREEIERLKEENKIQKEQIAEKDEEKREVIRQLSLAMDMLREENSKLRNKCFIARESPKKRSPPSDLHKWKGMFLGRLFSGSPK